MPYAHFLYTVTGQRVVEPTDVRAAIAQRRLQPPRALRLHAAVQRRQTHPRVRAPDGATPVGAALRTSSAAGPRAREPSSRGRGPRWSSTAARRGRAAALTSGARSPPARAPRRASSSATPAAARRRPRHAPDPRDPDAPRRAQRALGARRGRRARRRRTARSPRRAAPPGARAARRARPRSPTTPCSSGSRAEVDLQPHPARAADVPRVGRQAVREVDHRARAGPRQRATLREPRASVAGRGERGLGACGPRGTALQHRQARAGAAEPAGHADHVSDTRAVAADQRCSSSAQPTAVTEIVSAGALDHVPAEDRDPRRAASSCAPRTSSSACASVKPGGSPAQVCLARVGAHRGEIRERARQRPRADLRGRRPASPRRKCTPSTIASTEVAHTASRAHHRRVVADPAHAPDRRR